MAKYRFRKRLVEGLIKSRPNRFIMFVEVRGHVEKCHCPVTGQIASISFKDVPCLLSESENPDRATKFTVEAISLDPRSERKKSWIGINQTKVNEYIEFFLKSGELARIFPEIRSVQREVRLKKSRIDFLINGNDFLEVKILLKDIPSENHPNYKKRNSRFVSFGRMLKQFGYISNEIKRGSRAVVALCYLYDAKPFSVPKGNGEIEIVRSVKKSVSKGLEQWQVNLSLDREGIGLIDYFKLDPFG